MKKFLIKFLIIVIPLMVFAIYKSHKHLNELTENIQVSLNSYKPKTTYFIGDSHIEAIDCYSFDSNYVNMGQGSESIEVSIQKIKLLLDDNNTSSKTIYLGFSEHNLVTNPRYKDETDRRSYKLELYSSLKRNVFIISSPKKFLQFITCDGQQSSGFGDGRGTSNSNHFLREKHLNPKFEVQHLHFQDSSINKKLFYELVNLDNYIKSKNSNLILLNTPTTSIYRENIPKFISDSYSEMKSKLIIKNIQFMDFGSESFADSLFFDLNHLNVNGSKRILAKIFDGEIH